MKLEITIIAATSIMLSGCLSTTIKNPDEYTTIPMDKAVVFPSEVQLENRPYKVVVFDVNDKEISLARDAKSGEYVTRELVKQISSSNAVIVSKAGLSGLKEAIEMKKTGYHNSTEVDYAITGNISVAKYENNYEKAVYTKDKSGKLVHVSDPYCHHHTLLQGVINIYNARTLSLSHSFAISAGSLKDEPFEKNQPHVCRNLTHKEITNFLKSDGTSAAHREDVQLKNFFRPKGYVLEKRTKGDENIFRISIGKSSGVVKDQDAIFYTISEDRDPVTGKISQVQNKLGEGTVSDQVHDKHSWVLIKDKVIASKIKQGDIVKVVFAKSFMDKIFNPSYSN